VANVWSVCRGRVKRLSGNTLLLRAAVNYCVIQPVQKLHKLPGTAKTERKHYDDLEECHGQKGRISD